MKNKISDFHHYHRENHSELSYIEVMIISSDILCVKLDLIMINVIDP